MPLVGDAGGLVNRQLAFPGPLVGWTVAMVIVSTLAHVTTVLNAGNLTGPRVETRAR
ncbi:hypothetical protein AB0K16_59425 [Nonomuraea jabiensis]|uniref:hypothetical protein n=1 Tax=Nonomuraea jabiensis TaxID=882448 RepID=UPI00342E4BC7